ncbi:hypothetical protein Tco_0718403, partial [Tanacetum coccineum]
VRDPMPVVSSSERRTNWCYPLQCYQLSYHGSSRFDLDQVQWTTKKGSFGHGKRRMNSRTSMAQRDDVIKRTVYVFVFRLLKELELGQKGYWRSDLGQKPCCESNERRSIWHKMEQQLCLKNDAAQWETPSKHTSSISKEENRKSTGKFGKKVVLVGAGEEFSGTERKIASVGLPLNCKVADVVRNGVWCWPPELSNCFDALVAVTLPSVDDGMNERVLWRTNKGRLVDFSVSYGWYVADNCWFQLLECFDMLLYNWHMKIIVESELVEVVDAIPCASVVDKPKDKAMSDKASDVIKEKPKNELTEDKTTRIRAAFVSSFFAINILLKKLIQLMMCYVIQLVKLLSSNAIV